MRVTDSLLKDNIINYIMGTQERLAEVQRQVGHKSLRSSSVYLNPSEEAVPEAYAEAQVKTRQAPVGSAAYRDQKV